MKIVSDFREATWALVQQGISIIDFDYAGYAQEHLDRLLANAAAPDYRELLHDGRAARPGTGRVKDRAQVVIIGGGVGGASIAWHLAAGRLHRRARCVERAEITSGSHVPLGRARRPAPGQPAAHPDDDAQRRRVPAPRSRSRGDRTLAGVDRGRVAAHRVDAGADGGADPPARVGQDLRAPDGAARAERGARALPVDGRRTACSARSGSRPTATSTRAA